jgi:hypothetical protein
MCSIKDCPLCAAGDKPSRRWLIGVISRKTGTFKLLDISYAVFSQIQKYAKNTQRWGDPTKYDIDIVVDKNGGPTGYYAVQPIPKEPLSVADQTIKDSVDFDDLKRRVTPYTAEQVQKRIDKINGDAGKTSAPYAPQVIAPTPVKDDSSDEDESFPAYGG